jgi:hypothetical protein
MFPDSRSSPKECWFISPSSSAIMLWRRIEASITLATEAFFQKCVGGRTILKRACRPPNARSTYFLAPSWRCAIFFLSVYGSASLYKHSPFWINSSRKVVTPIILSSISSELHPRSFPFQLLDRQMWFIKNVDVIVWPCGTKIVMPYPMVLLSDRFEDHGGNPMITTGELTPPCSPALFPRQCIQSMLPNIPEKPRDRQLEANFPLHHN